jgi:hypothetical protein
MFIDHVNELNLTNEGDKNKIKVAELDGGRVLLETWTPESRTSKFTLDREAARALGLWLVKNTEAPKEIN